MLEQKTILICECAERGLLNLDGVDRTDAVIVQDLCRAAAENLPILGKITAAEHPVIYACHPRAIKALFEFAGYPLPEQTEFVNLRDPSIQSSANPAFHSSPAWYPVIDSGRCKNCGQCYEFCLFGVYEKDAQGRVKVTHPENCKNNCPACARICPVAAIIFPKAGEEPINGSEISDEDELKANIKVNVDEILGNDVYAALSARKQKRRALLDQKKIEQALTERKKYSEGNQ